MGGELKALGELLDYYELRARILPAGIVFSPLFISSISLAYVISQSVPWTAGAGVLAMAILYALSPVVRYAGRRSEDVIWRKWNGPPSTRFLRWKDDHFSDQMKQKYREAIRDVLGIELPNAAEEGADPLMADKRIGDAFKQVKGYIRRKDPEGLWRAQNVEYGFLRNLRGSLSLWLILSILGVALCGGLYRLSSGEVTLACMVANGSVLVLALVGCGLRTQVERHICDVADRYAEASLDSFMAVYRAYKNGTKA